MTIAVPPVLARVAIGPLTVIPKTEVLSIEIYRSVLKAGAVPELWAKR